MRRNTKLKCNNIKTLYNRLVDLLVAFAKIASIINTSTILSTQRRINRIEASHSKMGILLCQWRLMLCHRIKLLSLCSKLNETLKCKETIFLNNLLAYLLVTVATFEISLTLYYILVPLARKLVRIYLIRLSLSSP